VPHLQNIHRKFAATDKQLRSVCTTKLPTIAMYDNSPGSNPTSFMAGTWTVGATNPQITRVTAVAISLEKNPGLAAKWRSPSFVIIEQLI